MTIEEPVEEWDVIFEEKQIEFDVAELRCGIELNS